MMTSFFTIFRTKVHCKGLTRQPQMYVIVSNGLTAVDYVIWNVLIVLSTVKEINNIGAENRPNNAESVK